MSPYQTAALATAALAALAMTSGCASTAYQATQPDVAAMTCHGEWHQLRRDNVFKPSSDTPAKVQDYLEFSDVAQCLLRDGKPSVIALYDLGQLHPPSETVIALLLSTGGTFAASADLLGADFEIIEHHPFTDFTRRGDQYSLTLFNNAGQTKPFYLVLKADESALGKEDVVLGTASNTTVMPAGPVMFMYVSGKETRTVRPLIGGGKISVTGRPQAAAAFNQGRR